MEYARTIEDCVDESKKNRDQNVSGMVPGHEIHIAHGTVARVFRGLNPQMASPKPRTYSTSRAVLAVYQENYFIRWLLAQIKKLHMHQKACRTLGRLAPNLQ